MVNNPPTMEESWVGKIPWRRAWQPTPVFLPGESHGQRSLVGYTVHGVTELDMTELLSTHMLSCKYIQMRDFPGDSVVKILCFQCRRGRFNPWLGN